MTHNQAVSASFGWGVVFGGATIAALWFFAGWQPRGVREIPAEMPSALTAADAGIPPEIPVPKVTPFDDSPEKRAAYRVEFAYGYLYAREELSRLPPEDGGPSAGPGFCGWLDGFAAGRASGGKTPLPEPFHPMVRALWPGLRPP